MEFQSPGWCRAGQRFDCGAAGSVSLSFGKTVKDTMKPPSYISRNIQRQAQPTAGAAVDKAGWEEQRTATFAFTGEYAKWRGYACSIEAIPTGARYLSVSLQGHDTRGWAGHYGMKFTEPRLTWTAIQQAQDQTSSSELCFHGSFGAEGVSGECQPWPS